MLPRATDKAVAGHIWPARRYLTTPGLVSTQGLLGKPPNAELSSSKSVVPKVGDTAPLGAVRNSRGAVKLK